MANDDIDRILSEASGDEEYQRCPLRDELITRSFLLRVFSEKSKNIARILTSLTAAYHTITESGLRKQIDATLKTLVSEVATVTQQFDFLAAIVECDIEDDGPSNEKEGTA